MVLAGAVTRMSQPRGLRQPAALCACGSARCRLSAQSSQHRPRKEEANDQVRRRFYPWLCRVSGNAPSLMAPGLRASISTPSCHS